MGSAARPTEGVKNDPLVALNFRVPLSVRIRLKARAAMLNMSMTELLLTAVSTMDSAHPDLTRADQGVRSKD